MRQVPMPKAGRSVCTRTGRDNVCIDELTLQEVRPAIRKLKDGRAAGEDGIPPELFECVQEPVSQVLIALFARMTYLPGFD